MVEISVRAFLKEHMGRKGRLEALLLRLSNVEKEAMTPAQTWLEEHARFLCDTTDALRGEGRRFLRLPGGEKEKRVVEAAREMLEWTEGVVDEAAAVRFLMRRRETYPLTLREIACLPAALRLCLMERVDLSVREALRECGRMRTARELMRRGRGEQADPGDRALVCRVAQALSEGEEGEALRRLDRAVSARGASVESVLRVVREGQTAEACRLGRAVFSLRALEKFDTEKIAETVSPVYVALAETGGFERMDRKSRAYYAACAERLAREYCVEEDAVARTAAALARGKTGAEGDAGYYLIERPEDIAEALMVTPRRSFAEKHREGLFVAGWAAFPCLALAAGLIGGWPWWLFAPAMACAGEAGRQAVYPLLRRFHPPRLLPRVRLTALGAGQRVLVVVPALVTGHTHMMKMARHLSVLHRSVRTENVDFMLLADLKEADTPETDGDADTVRAGRAAFDALNAHTPGAPFLLWVRGRVWQECQGRYMGWERKRGALNMLCDALVTGRTEDKTLYASFAPAALKEKYAYVVTLDADTFLTRGALLRLVGVMEHPLQKGRTGVVQPRMAVGADTLRTRVQTALSGSGGLEVYGGAAQDVYQDLFGRGSFVGKGIFDPRLWRARLQDRLPQGRLLSHDLIEGETAGAALAEDIVLYDGEPSTIGGYLKRQHRWTRGDWQLLPFLTDGRLTLLSRFKVWENLRRSLVPLWQTVLLLGALWTGHPLLLLLALPWPLRGMGWRVSLQPALALCQADGAVRALYRQFVSRRGLLSWVTAQQAEEGAQGEAPLSCALASVACGAAAIGLSLMPGGFLPGVAAGLLWVLFPLTAAWLNGPLAAPPPLTEEETRRLCGLASDTWRFFEMYVTEKSGFLPPDNVQLRPDRGAAARTSPTNIGMYLLSCAAAREMNMMTGREMGRRMRDTAATLEKLEKWRGIFYNWYDTGTLSVLGDRFVSSVDAGNLAACLMACAQACRNHLNEMDESCRDVAARLDALASGMALEALYDPAQRLFFVGFDGSKNEMSGAHYDMLASESRLLSFCAVALGRVPEKHFFALNRTLVRAGGGGALLSWGGTMFEYLMPALLLPMYPGTLLREGCLFAVRAQRAQGKKRPWGVSESGYYAFDADLNYQYRAFGLPRLALTGETAGDVVAPYASALALPFFPRAAAENLLRMEKMGWRDGLGFFEAADYTPARMEKTPRLVRSHMAHHQGMLLCALCNGLENFALVRLFTRIPAVRARLYLLTEPMPRGFPRRRTELPLRRETDGGDFSAVPARTGYPLDAQALSFRGVTLLENARGQAAFFRGRVQLTRFEQDPRALSGPRVYLQGAGGVIRPWEGRAVYETGAIRYETEAGALRVRQWRFISPVNGALMDVLMLKNTGDVPLDVRAVSCLPVALSGQREDEAHPAFRDLSVRVDRVAPDVLCARRRPRDEKEQAETPLLYHAVRGPFARLGAQGDLRLFTGRCGDMRSPEALVRPVPGRLGDVLSPCLSWDGVLTVAPGGESLCVFAALPAMTEEEGRIGLEKGLPRAFDRAQLREHYALARTAALALCRNMRLTGERQENARRVLGAVYFTGQPHQAAGVPADMDELWRRGLSGDLPLWTVDWTAEADAPLLRSALRAHAWMRRMGVETDLAVLYPRETGYNRPVADLAAALVQSGPDREMMNRPGGVHLVAVGAGEAAGVTAFARLNLRGGAGLGAQLRGLARPQAAEEAPTVPLSLPADGGSAGLAGFNGWGGFTEDGGYRILRPAPVPWHLVLANGQIGTLVCETGILESFGENSRLHRLTGTGRQAYAPRPAERLILRVGGRDTELCGGQVTYTPGCAEYAGAAEGVETGVEVFVLPDRPVSARKVTLRAPADTEGTLIWQVWAALGERTEDTRLVPDGTEMTLVNAPAGLTARLSMTEAESCGAAGNTVVFRRQVRLRARESLTVWCLLSAGGERQERPASDAPARARAAWQDRLSALQVYTLQGSWDRLMNKWLPYQVRASRILARMGPYQAGGAVGFRDQLQDMLALVYTEPETVRAHLLRCAAHQFEEGDVQHWWHEGGRGVRTRVSDDRLFLPWVAAWYARATGDAGVFDAPAPFLTDAPLREDEEDRYNRPESTREEAPLREHCLRAVFSQKTGPHGMLLMGGGDWNDGMNRVGGESTWLTFFAVMVCRDLAPFCPPETAERLQETADGWLRASRAAWTGRWYLRAWYASGEPLGGSAGVSEPERIDLITQCFAVLAGAPAHQANRALLAAWERLYDGEAGLVKLLDPPFGAAEKAGYITAYLDGVRENGGQYTHAVAWFIWALCRAGESRRAWEVLRAVWPERHGNAPDVTRVYMGEPYVAAADVYAGENTGRAGWSWYTGSAGWLYVAALHFLMGFDRQGDRVTLSPLPGSGEKEITVTYRSGGAVYHLTAAQGQSHVTLDGRRQEEHYVTMAFEEGTHEARFPMEP